MRLCSRRSPDSDFEVLRTIAGEVVVIQEWRFSGRHTGPLLSAGPVPGPVAPTGRQVRLRGVSIYEAAGGKIVRETMYLDNATWAVELGVTPWRRRLGRVMRSGSW